MSNRKNRKRAVVAGAAAFVAFGAVVASAASLGGIKTGTLGADTVAIGSCDSDGVSVAYKTGYDVKAGNYQVVAVGVNDINPTCDGKSLRLTLTGEDGARLADGNATVSGGSATVSFTDSVAAKQVQGVAVIISD